MCLLSGRYRVLTWSISFPELAISLFDLFTLYGTIHMSFHYQRHVSLLYAIRADHIQGVNIR